MTDKLTAAGIEVPLELATYWDRKRDRASLGMQLCWAEVALDALGDLLVETTDELRRGNHMYAELTDRHTEALMRAEKAEVRIAELEAKNKRLEAALEWEVEVRGLYKRRQIDRLRTRVEKAEKALSRLEALDD